MKLISLNNIDVKKVIKIWYELHNTGGIPWNRIVKYYIEDKAVGIGRIDGNIEVMTSKLSKKNLSKVYLELLNLKNEKI